MNQPPNKQPESLLQKGMNLFRSKTGEKKTQRRITESPFPKRNQDALRGFFGEMVLDRGTGRPELHWEAYRMVRMPVVYPMTLAAAPDITVHHILVHQEVETSLKAIFHEILEKLGSMDAVKAARADILGEAYSFRPEEGGHQLSMHAYGAAITLDPENNPYGKAWEDQGMIHEVVIEAFLFHGWKWGGDRKENPHCAYFEALS